ncbi:FAD-dependent oxidoreductase [Actinomadura luteofluorescens]|uniref:FAD-dependent oxidoreductase n=1 Tax=Actinomadura luteofluorescens TaxID=46163 RepID=UPI00362C2B55
MRVLVVGAGIIGAALADRLTRPASGAAVRLTVVEAEGPGAGTSGASYAWINANDPSDPGYHRFRTAAMSTWRDLAGASTTRPGTGRRATSRGRPGTPRRSGWPTGSPASPASATPPA